MAAGEFDVGAAVASAARQTAWLFPGFVDREELEQEGWAHFLAHRDRYTQGDPAYAQHNGVRALRGVMSAYARRQKAASLGYEPGDEFFYHRTLVEALLPAVVLGDRERPVLGSPERAAKGDPAEGGEYVAMRADVEMAWERADLTEAQRRLLVDYYVAGFSQEEMAQALGVARQTVGRRIHRAVRVLVDFLGGQRPVEGDEWIDRRLRERP